MYKRQTYPLILAKIPVKNPWEIFAYLPFGNWNIKLSPSPQVTNTIALRKLTFLPFASVKTPHRMML